MANLTLPRGRHSIPRELVIENQRERMLDGVAAALQERTYGDLSVVHITEAAGVSRATLYEIFGGKRECVAVAHERAFERLSTRVRRSCASAVAWDEKLAAGIGAGLGFAAEWPQEARLLLLDVIGPDPVLADLVLASNEGLVALMRAGRRRCPEVPALPEITERALIGAITSVAGAHLMGGKIDDLVGLEPQLVELMLTQYPDSTA